jgi:hypothetical protein
MTDFYENQKEKVAWGEAVEEFIRNPVYLRLKEEMKKDVAALTRKLRKGTGNILDDDRIRAGLDVWERWDSQIQSWLGAKAKALKELTQKGE